MHSDRQETGARPRAARSQKYTVLRPCLAQATARSTRAAGRRSGVRNGPCSLVLVLLLLSGCSGGSAPLSSAPADQAPTPAPAPRADSLPPALMTSSPASAAAAEGGAVSSAPATPTVRPLPPAGPPTVTLIPPTIIALPDQAGGPSALPAVPGPSADPPARYVFPLTPVDAADYGACHHDYPASDIFAPRGTSFVAVTDGTVEWVSQTDEWDPAVDDPATRSGLAVSIIGDDGMRYYGSHLETVADGIIPGRRVLPGMVLGTVGTSGNAATTPPHVHFGLSGGTTPNAWQTRRGTMSPLAALNTWKSGGSLPPDREQTAGGVC